MSPKPEASEAEPVAGSTGINPEAQRQHEQAEAERMAKSEQNVREVLEAEEEAGIKRGPNEQVFGMMPDSEGHDQGNIDAFAKAEAQAKKDRPKHASLEPGSGDNSELAKLYRGTIPKNGAHGLVLSPSDAEQLANVHNKGDITTASFRSGMQVVLGPGKHKSASGFRSKADKQLAAQMIVDQAMREGPSGFMGINKRMKGGRIHIHSYDIVEGRMRTPTAGNREFAKELYREAQRRGLSVNTRDMAAIDVIGVKMSVWKEKLLGKVPKREPAQAFEDPKQPAPANDDIKIDKGDDRVAGLNGKMSQSPDPAVEAIKANTEQLKALKDLLNGGGRSVNGNNNVAATGDGANAIKGDNNHIGDRHNHFHGDVHVHVDARSLGGLSGLSGLGGLGGGMPGGHDSGGDAEFVSGVAEKMHGRRHDAMVAGFIEGKEVKRIGHDSGPRRIEGPDTPRLTGPDDGGSAGQRALPSAERKALPAPPKALPAPPKALPPPKSM